MCDNGVTKECKNRTSKKFITLMQAENKKQVVTLDENGTLDKAISEKETLPTSNLRIKENSHDSCLTAKNELKTVKDTAYYAFYPLLSMKAYSMTIKEILTTLF